MMILIKLLLAHLLGDFLLQPTAWVLDKEAKKQRSVYLYLHVVLHGVLAWLLVGELAFGGSALVLAVLHGVVDLIKLHFQQKKTKRVWFWMDQIVHVVVLLLVGILYTHTAITPSALDPRFWVVVTGLLFLTQPTSILIKNSISVWTPEPQDQKEDSLRDAGNYIGILERLFVFCFILTGHFEAIGFLLAAKSIFRFGDLKEAKDRKLTEYVLIGTLLSFGLAVATGLLVQFGL